MITLKLDPPRVWREGEVVTIKVTKIVMTSPGRWVIQGHEVKEVDQ